MKFLCVRLQVSTEILRSQHVKLAKYGWLSGLTISDDPAIVSDALDL